MVNTARFILADRVSQRVNLDVGLRSGEQLRLAASRQPPRSSPDASESGQRPPTTAAGRAGRSAEGLRAVTAVRTTTRTTAACVAAT